MSAPPLLIFTHCSVRAVVVDLPTCCPACGAPLALNPLPEPPIALPSPIVSGHRHPFAFVLQPTRGGFLSGYKTDDDLHVGITSSNGEVFSFGPDGVGRDRDGWRQCLVVPLLGASALAVRHAWDAWLDTFSEIPAWQSLRYDEHDHNCLDFALDFWNSVLAQEQHPPLSKLDFTALYVLPVLRRASRYLFLLEGATQHGCHLVNTAYAAYSTDSLASMMLS